MVETTRLSHSRGAHGRGSTDNGNDFAIRTKSRSSEPLHLASGQVPSSVGSTKVAHTPGYEGLRTSHGFWRCPALCPHWLSPTLSWCSLVWVSFCLTDPHHHQGNRRRRSRRAWWPLWASRGRPTSLDRLVKNECQEPCEKEGNLKLGACLCTILKEFLSSTTLKVVDA